MTTPGERSRLPAPLMIEPLFIAKAWGGGRLGELLGTTLPHDRVGECLAISAHPDHDCLVRSGPLAGTPLSEVWRSHKALFGHAQGDRLPIQVKLIDAREHLSVQVHPDEECARVNHLDGPKSECWYVLGASHEGRVLLGTRDASALYALGADEQGSWDQRLDSLRMRDGDFFWVPAGAPHCLLAGSLVYEVLQSSNVTFRLHDHGRTYDNGKPRELHLEDGINAVRHVKCGRLAPVVTLHETVMVSQFLSDSRFSVARWDITGAAQVPMPARYLLAGCIGGEGEVNGSPVRSGDHFIVPNAHAINLRGTFTLMVTAPGVG